MSEQEKKNVGDELLLDVIEYGADLLAQTEGRAEVKTERTAEAELIPDARGVIDEVMQTMMAMVTFSMIMPMVQQTIVGALQSTEVTVVVKPGSIVSVEVTNSILAVEVQGGNVNVTLEHSTIMLPVDLQGTTIMLPIDVQGATIMMPVDIQAQYVTLEVNITKIEEAVINILEASKIGINVMAQSVDVKMSGVWQSIKNLDWIRIIDDQVDVEGNSVYGHFPFSYTVPAGKRLVIMMIKAVLTAQWNFGIDAIGNRYPTAGFWPSVKTISDGYELIIEVNDVIVDDVIVTPKNPIVPVNFSVPLVLNEGDTLVLKPYALTGTSYVLVELYGYEEEVA